LVGNAIEITLTNFTGLSLLCEEFGFEGLLRPLWEFRHSINLNETKDSEARLRVSALEERVHQNDRDIARLKSQLTLLTTNIKELSTEVAELRVGSLPDKNFLKKFRV
jgi:uncharacterized coiled-coil protein SlyX